MNIFRELHEIDAFGPRSVVTIGNFDGVHRGHQLILGNVRRRAHELQARSIAITFDPHPACILRPDVPSPQITPLPEKLRLLALTGVDAVLVLPFTPELRDWTARQFAESVLRDRLNTVEVHEGETFRFGRGAEAGIEGLAHLGQDCNFAVRRYDPLILRGGVVSSSRIRTLLSEGAVAKARALLGHDFSIASTPAPGRGYGRRYAVPTINLAAYDGIIPGNGVYVTTLRVGEGESARVFRGVTNAGNRPTFGADSFAIETHLLDYEPVDLSASTPLELRFLRRLRAEQRFESTHALAAQIGRDVARAQRFFAFCDASTTSANPV